MPDTAFSSPLPSPNISIPSPNLSPATKSSDEHPPTPRPVRVLCLHGYSSNGILLEKHLQPIRSRLPQSWEWHYIDGDYPVPLSTSPPGEHSCRSYYPTPDAHHIDEAHCQVHLYTLLNGLGYDIILGFGQGAALAASILLHEQRDWQIGESEFKLGVFFSSTIPYAKCLQAGYNARHVFGIEGETPEVVKDRPTDVPGEMLPTEEQNRFQCQEHETVWEEDFNVVKRVDKDGVVWRAETRLCMSLEGHEGCRGARKTDKTVVVDKGERTFYQMFHPDVEEARIQIPTVHIHGRNDPWRVQGRALMRMCDEDKVQYAIHEGGHEIPGWGEDLDDVVEAIREGLKEAGIPLEDDE
ncbi:hypothetical protein QC763_606480 [Podospora pseudopauciseta]|uniref:Serine hydrolase domain-containing protein n=1 Tax=Podospora pseudopauciseta TaxID=2093780 RepID=A0ABR0H5L0_9PEZI|nr:hypothetical protein QC763_606480 [Podospora pseudopauciseta]